MLLTWKTVGTALPLLFFSCHLRLTGGRKPKDRRHKTGPYNLRYNLVFFSTFEELILPIKGPMEDHDAGWSSFMNHPQHHVSTWLSPQTWWAESP
jgi:hypothetical protein